MNFRSQHRTEKMHNETCNYEIDDRGTATVTLNRPLVHNALSAELIHALDGLLNDIGHDSEIRTVVLCSSGNNFCAGMDLQSVHNSEFEQYAYILAQTLRTLYQLSKPTIAIVQGSAIGGGAGLVACCDSAIAAVDAKFCFAEVRLGLMASTISPYIIRAIGPRASKHLFLTAETIDATEAYRLGLVHKVLDHSDFAPSLREYTDKIRAGGRAALKATKLLVDEVSTLEINSATSNLSAEWLVQIQKSSEASEGISAFLGKRKPRWTG